MPKLLVRSQAGKNILHIKSENSASIGEICEYITGLIESRSKLSDLRNMANDILTQGVCLPDNFSENHPIPCKSLIEETMKDFMPKGGYSFKLDNKGHRSGIVASDAGEQRKFLREISEFLENQSFTSEIGEKFSSVEEFEMYSEKIICCIQEIYPDNLPDNEPFRLYLNHLKGVKNNSTELSQIILWFAGKRMSKNELLSKYTNNKDECKLVVSVSSAQNDSAPVRCGYSKEDQEKMYQQILQQRAETERLQHDFEENRNSISHLNKDWADSRQMYKQLHKMNVTRYKM